MRSPAAFHNTFLVGNGRWCSCCFPDGPPDTVWWREKVRKGCNECAGAGRIVFSAQEIIAATVVESRAWRERAT